MLGTGKRLNPPCQWQRFGFEYKQTINGKVGGLFVSKRHESSLENELPHCQVHRYTGTCHSSLDKCLVTLLPLVVLV